MAFIQYPPVGNSRNGRGLDLGRGHRFAAQATIFVASARVRRYADTAATFRILAPTAILGYGFPEA